MEEKYLVIKTKVETVLVPIHSIIRIVESTYETGQGLKTKCDIFQIEMEEPLFYSGSIEDLISTVQSF